MHKRHVLLFVWPLVLSGCAGLYEQQYPAPVYAPPYPVYRQPAPLPPPQVRVRPPSSPITTTPIPEFNQQLIPIQPAPATEALGGALPSVPDAGGSMPMPGINPLPSAPLQLGFNTPPAQTYTMTPFQPIEPSASSSPAVGALVTAANRSSQKGNLDSAVATIERARSIEPSNAGLYYKLALLRIKQSKPKLAEELAKKAALLAAGDRHLKKHSWLLIAHAREMQKDFQGAKAARDKANRF